MKDSVGNECVSGDVTKETTKEDEAVPLLKIANTNTESKLCALVVLFLFITLLFILH